MSTQNQNGINGQPPPPNNLYPVIQRPQQSQARVSQRNSIGPARAVAGRSTAAGSTAGPARSHFLPPNTSNTTNNAAILKKISELETSQKNAMINFRKFERGFDRPWPDIKNSKYHKLMYLLPDPKIYRPGDILHPYPAFYVHNFNFNWNGTHVRMPCDESNLRVIKVRVSGEHSPGGTPVYTEKIIKIWPRIQESLARPINSVDDIGSAMRYYYCETGSLNVLSRTLDKLMSQSERTNFFTKVIPAMTKLCMELPDIVTGAIPLLTRHKNYSISFTQKQIACLLANAFFSTFPERADMNQEREQRYPSYPTFNFNEFLTCSEVDDSKLILRAQKLRCLLHYFARVTSNMPTGVVTYTRKSTFGNNGIPDFKSSKSQLKQMVIRRDGTIEDDGKGMLQVDFANKNVGGGVLGNGCVQEEIIFVTYPELILARLFTETLADTEALFVTGCERFSQHSGYAQGFKFVGDYVDNTKLDTRGRRLAQWTAIDALRFLRDKPNTQFGPNPVLRELNKAYIGFSYSCPRPTSVAVATGLWGCGAFNGDPYLKAMIQYLAASEAGRDVAFFTFEKENPQLQIQENLYQMVQSIRNKTVGDVFKMLTNYHELLETDPTRANGLPKFFSDSIPNMTSLAIKDKLIPAPPQATSARTPISEQEFYGITSEEQPFETKSNFPKVINTPSTSKSGADTGTLNNTEAVPVPTPKPGAVPVAAPKSGTVAAKRQGNRHRLKQKPTTVEIDPVANPEAWKRRIATLKAEVARRAGLPVPEIDNGVPNAPALPNEEPDEPRVLNDQEILAIMDLADEDEDMDDDEDEEEAEIDNDEDEEEAEIDNDSDSDKSPPPSPPRTPTFMMVEH